MVVLSKPTPAQISVFVHWDSQSKDMSLVKCDECPFESLCNNDDESLCGHLDRLILTWKKKWGLDTK